MPSGSSASPKSSGSCAGVRRPICRRGRPRTAPRPHRAAEQVRHRPPERLALDVEAATSKALNVRSTVPAASIEPVSPWRVAPDGSAQGARRGRENLVRGEHVEAAKRLADASKPLEVTDIAVRLAESGDAASVSTSMIERRANGSCTPTAFNSGGS